MTILYSYYTLKFERVVFLPIHRIKLKVSNTIRWRKYMDDCGNVVKESNARMVKWSDGSMSLHLGNEIFDVYKQPLQGDHNHLFIRQGTGLQGQAVFRTKLTFRPHSTESFTHKKMTKTLADRSQKTSSIKILTQVGYDPDVDRYSNLKKEEEKLRQAMRAKPAAKPKRSRGEAAAITSSSYQDGEHDSDDEGVISLSAIKNKHKQKYNAGGKDSGKQGMLYIQMIFLTESYSIPFNLFILSIRNINVPFLQNKRCCHLFIWGGWLGLWRKSQEKGGQEQSIARISRVWRGEWLWLGSCR